MQNSNLSVLYSLGGGKQRNDCLSRGSFTLLDKSNQFNHVGHLNNVAFPDDSGHLKCPAQTSELGPDLPQSECWKKKQPEFIIASGFTLHGDPTQLKYLDQWTADEIASWLLAIGLANCAAKVQTHDIAGDVAGDVTFQDAAEMGLREIDAYRLVRALEELRVLVDEVWRRPNQLSDRLKQDSLERHRAKWNQNQKDSLDHQCINSSGRDKGKVHQASQHLKQRSSLDAVVCQAPLSPQTPPLLPIKKRVRFDDEIHHIAC